MDIQRLKRTGLNVEQFKNEWEHAIHDIKNAKQIRNNDKSKRITSSGRRFRESKTSKIKRGVYHGIIKENEKRNPPIEKIFD